MSIQGLGSRLRHARKLRKFSQVALAKAAGIKQASVSELETGETKEISGPTLIAICAALKVRPEWLVTGKEPMESQALVAPDLEFRVDEATAVKQLREGLPEWRSYVLSLAIQMKDHSQQKLFLDVMRQAVPDERIEASYGDAPHVRGGKK